MQVIECSSASQHKIVVVVGDVVESVADVVEAVGGVVESVGGVVAMSSRADVLPKNLIALLLLGCRVLGKNAASEASSSGLPMHLGRRNGDNKRAAQ
jgi:hypothetical protein